MQPQAPSQHVRDKSGYLSSDTIAAVSTAVGGPVAIIRISGPRSHSLVNQLARRPIEQKLEHRKFIRSTLWKPSSVEANSPKIPSEPLDDALVVGFHAPESFTGEEMAEIHAHGGAFSVSTLLDTLISLGARQALPGEFSFRAIRNGKMSLSQAQAVTDLIRASNDNAVSLALEKMSGTQNLLIRKVAEDLRNLAVLGEAGIDFSDQDIDEVSLPQLKRKITPLLDTLDRLLSSYARGSKIQDGLRTAFIGLPNAGKSSFFNALLGEERSIVSEIAGTTRDVIRETLTVRGKRGSITLRLEDTAGLRSSEDRVEQMGVARSEKAAREADLVIFLLDPTSELEPVQRQWNRLAADAPGAWPEKALGVITKCDVATPQQLNAARLAFLSWGGHWCEATSAITGEGLASVSERMVEMSLSRVQRMPGVVVLTRLDHFQAVQESVAHLKRALESTESELFASDIRQALHSMSDLIGETATDDILGRIFSDFCIGK